eukprot:GEMP01006081.1.p1 GENE.GEMP01006081.1~~GEMP01006081.1.p1  ORF type:complete len:908 (+),score=208.30 GEMP01006081.1:1077-3800(+)
MALVYHEKQQNRLCGKHCLNNLLQSPIFDHPMMHQIAQSIDNIEARLLFEDEKESPTEISEHHSTEGDFSIEVLFAALRRLNVDLVPGRHPDAANVIVDGKFRAIVVQSNDHWFAIRKIFGSWLNLDSLLAKPHLISNNRMFRWLNDPPHSTNVFLVIGELPTPATPTNDEPWVVVPDIVPASAHPEKPDEKPAVIKEPSNYKPAVVKEPPVVKELSNYDKLIDLGFDDREVSMALELSGNDLEKAGELLSSDRSSVTPRREDISTSTKASAVDAQLAQELYASVKDIYRAQTHMQVVNSFFQIYRLALLYPSMRSTVLLSSLRHALRQKRPITETSARSEIRKFFTELERKNPSYKRLSDMGFTDLEIRCAMLLYPNELDIAAGILLQPQSESARELFSLLRSSTCEEDAKAFLLRVVQVAASNPGATPTNDLLSSLKGQKENLGKTGLFTATRLLEYLDHENAKHAASFPIATDVDYVGMKAAKKKVAIASDSDGADVQRKLEREQNSEITLDNFPKPRSGEKRVSPRTVATKPPVTKLGRTPSASSTAVALAERASFERHDDVSPQSLYRDVKKTDPSSTFPRWEDYRNPSFTEHSRETDKAGNNTAPAVERTKSDPFPKEKSTFFSATHHYGLSPHIIGSSGKSPEESSGLSPTHGSMLSLSAEVQRARELRLREHDRARQELDRDRARQEQHEEERLRKERERGRIRHDQERDSRIRAEQAREREQVVQRERQREREKEHEREKNREQERERIRRDNDRDRFARKEVQARAVHGVPIGGIIRSRTPDNREMRYSADRYSDNRMGGTQNLPSRLASRDALNTLGTDRWDRARTPETRRSLYDSDRYRAPHTYSGFPQGYKPLTPDSSTDAQFYARLWDQRQTTPVAQRRSASSGRVKELRPWR